MLSDEKQIQYFKKDDHRDEDAVDIAIKKLSPEEKNEVYALIRQAVVNRFSVSREYTEAHQRFFPLYDEQNTARAYEVVKELSARG